MVAFHYTFDKEEDMGMVLKIMDHFLKQFDSRLGVRSIKHNAAGDDGIRVIALLEITESGKTIDPAKSELYKAANLAASMVLLF